MLFSVTSGDRLYPFQRWLPGKFSCGRLPGSVWLGSSQHSRRNQWKFIWRPPLTAVHNRWTHVKLFVCAWVACDLVLLVSIVHQMEESVALIGFIWCFSEDLQTAEYSDLQLSFVPLSFIVGPCSFSNKWLWPQEPYSGAHIILDILWTARLL